jgi:hypothetical protein
MRLCRLVASIVLAWLAATRRTGAAYCPNTAPGQAAAPPTSVKNAHRLPHRRSGVRAGP